MGPSAAEIDQQIKETRQQLDANLGLLEARAARKARQVARIAGAVAVGVAATAGIGFFIYRMRQHRTASSRVSAAVRLPRAWESIARKAATTVAVSVAGGLASRLLAPREAHTFTG